MIKAFQKGNLVWTTWVVNRMKNDLTYFQFLDFCRKVVEYKL